MTTTTMLLPKSTPTPPPSVDLDGSASPATLTSADTISITGLHLDMSSPVTIPHKHMVQPNPGGIKFTTPVTPPASPPEGTKLSNANACTASLLYPPDEYSSLSTEPPIYAIDAPAVAAAISFTSRQPMPDIDQIFPWAHGLHQDNSMQLSFFFARKKNARRPPTCFRGLCIVKVGRDFSKSRLKGAVMPEEILPPSTQTGGFLPVDPREGFGVRNFHIQVGKFAILSDVIVYGDEETDSAEVMNVAKRVSEAQIYTRSLYNINGIRNFPTYSTLVVQDPFSVFEQLFPELVTIDTLGNLTGKVIDFCHWERMEMCSMSKASKIHNNVYLGSTTDARYHADKGPKWDVFIEASDVAQMPTSHRLLDLLEASNHSNDAQFLEFPGSGTITSAHRTRSEINSVIDTCRWIYALANGETMEEENVDSDGDQVMCLPSRSPRKVLLHCSDGYTETSLLALAYLMYAEVLPVHEAWIKLHTEKKRNFFAYEKDLAFLRHIERSLLDAAARNRDMCIDYSSLAPPEWIYRMDGSLPSRVLSYMYLGNLLHANNHGMLTAMGIKRVLSIGEELSWTEAEREAFGPDNVMVLRDLQDNGCDPLQFQFWRCLDFIEEGHRKNEPVLVHCRVGVSRSATICIAEVMRTMRLSLPRAYCYVRARRLNVIIQPHLRFMYELLKFEESLSMKTYRVPKRELEWIHVAREIAVMNRPYTR